MKTETKNGKIENENKIEMGFGNGIGNEKGMTFLNGFRTSIINEMRRIEEGSLFNQEKDERIITLHNNFLL